MNITKDTVIGQLVASDYRTAAVFKNHEIDFCCNGNTSIGDACSREQLAPELLIAELQEATTTQTTTHANYDSWPLDLLADYIEKKHHRYVRKRIGEISPFLDKVVRVHGGRHPELGAVQELFEASALELTVHMQKEEKVLFPHIRKMIEAGRPVAAPFGKIENPIQVMLEEHDSEGERFRKIASLTRNYTPPADACNTYRTTYALLQEFEQDLHLHIHLENNILFPKSIAWESGN
ncbi:iron-sulfur cluster repair di-iron protein [Niabella terrae]